jgi:hypothetical protein
VISKSNKKYQNLSRFCNREAESGRERKGRD